jgi:hypothetical protein
MNNFEEIDNLIREDTAISSPELDDSYVPIHTALETSKYKSYKHSSECCSLITRYYEDNRFARAYGLMVYEGGIAIIYDKYLGLYYTITLGEDDGVWFPKDCWNFSKKSDYIACMAEALSIFNSNFKL